MIHFAFLSIDKYLVICKDNPHNMTANNALIKQMRETGMDVINNLDNKNLLQLILKANQTYREGNPFLTDAEYDTIVTMAYERKGMKTKLDKIVGAPVANERKTVLPYFMGSMNKIKPDTNAVADWKKKFLEPYVFSAKLDGVSGLYVVKNGEAKLYTRGNGTIGQDITFLLPQFKLPVVEGAVIRGEFLISKNAFETRWKNTFSNARNMVSGLINAKRQPVEKYSDLEFVAYEVIEPQVMPSMAFQYLKENGFNTVKNGQILMAQNLTNEFLSKKLVEWRDSLPYEIDGVIVTSDHMYPRRKENPKHSFAFKMVLSDQVVEAHVVDVLWAASKDGYLKPRVKITPVSIGGATIEYATGFNAAFIQENKIGVGAIVKLIRSGDVIPHIQEVIQSAAAPLFPKVAYKWNDTNIDIYVDQSAITNDNTFAEQILVKNLLYFFKGMGVKYLSIGNITNLVHHKYNTVGKILAMKSTDFVEIDGMGATIGEKIVSSIEDVFKTASLADIMIHSNKFGRNLGPKKIGLIMSNYPDILTTKESNEVKYTKVVGLNGFAEKSANDFIQNIPGFLTWIKAEGLSRFLNKPTPIVTTTQKTTTDKLKDKTLVFTGFRDKTLEDFVTHNGGKLTTNVTKQTHMLVYKPGGKGSKVEKAKSLGVYTVTLDNFKIWVAKNS